MYSDGVCEDIGAGQIHFIKKGCTHKIEVYHDEDFRYICIGYNRNNNEENIRDFGELVKYKNAFILNDDSTVKKLTSLLLMKFICGIITAKICWTNILCRLLFLCKEL